MNPPEKAVTCPTCKAKSGEPCRSTITGESSRLFAHTMRTLAWIRWRRSA